MSSLTSTTPFTNTALRYVLEPGQGTNPQHALFFFDVLQGWSNALEIYNDSRIHGIRQYLEPHGPHKICAAAKSPCIGCAQGRHCLFYRPGIHTGEFFYGLHFCLSSYALPNAL